MSPAALLASLRARGFTLRVEGDRILVAPASRLDAAELERLREWKAEVIRMLIADSAARVRRIRTHCVTCGEPLPDDAWTRCHSCVDTAYTARDAEHRKAADTS